MPRALSDREFFCFYVGQSDREFVLASVLDVCLVIACFLKHCVHLFLHPVIAGRKWTRILTLVSHGYGKV